MLLKQKFLDEQRMPQSDSLSGRAWSRPLQPFVTVVGYESSGTAVTVVGYSRYSRRVQSSVTVVTVVGYESSVTVIATIIVAVVEPEVMWCIKYARHIKYLRYLRSASCCPPAGSARRTAAPAGCMCVHVWVHLSACACVHALRCVAWRCM